MQRKVRAPQRKVHATKGARASSTRVLGSTALMIGGTAEDCPLIRTRQIMTIGRRAAAKRPGGYNRRDRVLLSYWYLRPRLIPVCFCLIPTSSAGQICVTLEQKVFLGNFAA